MEQVLAFAHRLVRAAVPAAGVGVDATLGRGRDALVLAEAVGPDGQVHGFDVQAEAVAASGARLARAGVAARATLHHAGHEHAVGVLPEALRGGVHAVMFNLGYLPGGDPRLVTLPRTTVAALDGLSAWLAPGGVLTVVVYEQHPGGAEEGAAVARWADALDPGNVEAVSYRFINRPRAPWLLAVERLR